MKKVLVATDFSTRSDRALRRATLLCKKHGSEMLVVHAVDDDQAPRLLEAEREIARSLLEEQAQSLREIDNLPCTTELRAGDPYEAITKAAAEHAADLIVIGPHRRHVIEDTFVGTTAERIVKASPCPVLMANGVPAGFYRHALLALELTASGRSVAESVHALGIDRQVGVSALHVLDSPITSLLVSSALSDMEVEEARLDEEVRASGELAAFLDGIAFSPMGRLVALNEGSIASTILSRAKANDADMVIVGTECRTGLVRLVLGSVAEEVLRRADVDVLAIPTRQG